MDYVMLPCSDHSTHLDEARGVESYGYQCMLV
jgi:hypothetical protein